MARRYGKFVDFNDPTQVGRRPGKKRVEYLEIIYTDKNYSY